MSTGRNNARIGVLEKQIKIKDAALVAELKNLTKEFTENYARARQIALAAVELLLAMPEVLDADVVRYLGDTQNYLSEDEKSVDAAAA